MIPQRGVLCRRYSKRASSKGSEKLAEIYGKPYYDDCRKKRHQTGKPAMGGCGAWGKEPPSYSCGVLGQVCKSKESVYTAADTQCHPKADDKGHFCGKDTCLCKRERSCSTGNALNGM